MALPGPLKRAVFLDRDGVLNEPLVRDGKPYPPPSAAALEIVPGAARALARLKALGLPLIVVTNQPDVARGAQTAQAVEAMHARLRRELPLDDVLACFHDDRDACACRKPQPGLILEGAARHGADPARSYLIGDRWRDIAAGRAARCRTVWLDRGYRERPPESPDARVTSLAEAVAWIENDIAMKNHASLHPRERSEQSPGPGERSEPVPASDASPPTRVALVGAGYVAAYHARALRSLPFIELAAVADPDQDHAQSLAEQFAIPRVYPSLQAMAEVRPQVVHILTPPATHAALTLEALDLGCHVFVEKPMAETAADCDRMIARARERGLVLSVNHSARMDPIVLRALELLRRGACGQITGADFFRSSDYQAFAGGPHMPPWFRNGSYPFQDLGVHALYLLEAVLGPILHADIRYYASGMGDPNLVFDEWRALVECEKAPGHIYISWNVRPIQNELVVHGTRGVMTVDCYLQTISLRKTWPAPKPVQRILSAGLGSLGMLWKVTANTLRFATGRLLPSPGIHVSVVKFHEALRRGEPPPVPAEEGRRAIALLEDVSRHADADKRLYLAERPPSRPPRILVTGAGGFLGRALVHRLRAQGEPLRLFLRRPPAVSYGDDVHLAYGDLGHSDTVDRAVRGIDTIYHVGAAMRGGNFEFASGTLWGTRNIIDACERHGVRRLVYVSSMSVLDHAGHQPGAPVDESHPYEPRPGARGLYTQTKLEAEKMVLAAAAAGRVSAVILRPGQIYGPGAEKTPPSGTIALAGRWLVVGSGRRYVPFVFVENVIDAMLLAAAAADLPNGSLFQLVDPQGMRQKDYIEALRRGGRDVRVSYVPAWFLAMAGWGIELLGKALKRPMPLTPYRVRSITPLWPCDCTAAHTRLGWTPRYSIAEGMAATFPPSGRPATIAPVS